MGGAMYARPFPPWVLAPSRGFGKRPFPGDQTTGWCHLCEPAVQNGKIPLIHLTSLEPGGKMPVYGPSPCHQEDTTCVAIKAVDRVQAAAWTEAGIFAQVAIGLEQQRQSRTKIFTRGIMDTHTSRFVDRQPAHSSRQNGNW